MIARLAVFTVVVLCLCPIYTGGSLSITATPPEINTIDPKPLTIKCTYTPRNGSNDQPKNLTLSKIDCLVGGFYTLTTIQASNPRLPKLSSGAGENGVSDVQGHIYTTGISPSYISAIYNKPTAKNEGTYMCTAKAITKNGAPKFLTQEVIVKDGTVQYLQKKLQSIEDRLSTQAGYIDKNRKLINGLKNMKDRLSTQAGYIDKNRKLNNSLKNMKDRLSTLSVKRYKYDGHIYTWYNHKSTAATAEAVCSSRGAYVMEVDDKLESDYIFEVLKRDKGYRVLTGGRLDRSRGKRWFWRHSGKEMTFTPWGPGQPSDTRNIEDCLEIHVRGKRWNDIRCDRDDVYTFLCEQPE